jgi:uncharacterized Tic20 family protein
MAGLTVFIGIFAALIVLKNKSPEIKRLMQDKPYMNLALNLVVAGILLNLLGSLAMFLFSICMPLLRKIRFIGYRVF